MNNKVMEIPYLSVVVPAYNEAGNFARGTLDQLYAFLLKSAHTFELLLVDDGSVDETVALMRQFAQDKAEVMVLALPHRGKGPTVREGMLRARGENRLFTDFDQSTPIVEVEKLLAKRDEGYDLAIGSREIKGARREAEPWYRHLMGKGFNFGVKLLTVRGIMDTQCGFKLFSKRAVEAIFPKLAITVEPKPDAFTGALDVEILFLAQKFGFKIAEVPVYWKHVHSARVSPVKDSLRMAKDVVRIRLADIIGRYEA
jgi:glycosyltransferase involved in cell wall biosynthesis